MHTLRLTALCALAGFAQHGLGQQLEAYTPLERERWIQEEQPLKLKVVGGFSYDSNLFRLSDDVDAESTIGSSDKSDVIYRVGAGGKYDLRYSRQKFVAEANVTAYKFQNFDNLDNTSNDLRGEWLWQLGNSWDGNLGIGHRRYLESFANFQRNLRDMVSQDRVFGSANYLVNSRVKLTLEGGWAETEHGEQTRDVLDSKVKDTAFTVNWITPAQNTLGLQYRTEDATFPNPDVIGSTLVSNDYSENEISVVAHWALSGVSEARARVGYTKREFDQLGNRDFSDPTWRLAYLWRPTGKLAFEFSTWREIAAFQDLTANYARETGFSVVPTWSLTPKVVLRGKIHFADRSYVGDPGLVAAAQERKDKDQIYQVSALWTPLRLTEFAFSLESGKRTSNLMFVDYQYELVSVLGTLYF